MVDEADGEMAWSVGWPGGRMMGPVRVSLSGAGGWGRVLRTVGASGCFSVKAQASYADEKAPRETPVSRDGRCHAHIVLKWASWVVVVLAGAYLLTLFVPFPLAAKQAAFEEANKIKNQFRALDDDEIEFLDGVLVSVRCVVAWVLRVSLVV